MQTDHRHGCVVRLPRALLENVCRQNAGIHILVKLTAAQGFLSSRAVTEQHQRLSPTQGQPLHRFTAIGHRQARRWGGCPNPDGFSPGNNI